MAVDTHGRACSSAACRHYSALLGSLAQNVSRLCLQVSALSLKHPDAQDVQSAAIIRPVLHVLALVIASPFLNFPPLTQSQAWLIVGEAHVPDLVLIEGQYLRTTTHRKAPASNASQRLKFGAGRSVEGWRNGGGVGGGGGHGGGGGCVGGGGGGGAGAGRTVWWGRAGAGGFIIIFGGGGGVGEGEG